MIEEIYRAAHVRNESLGEPRTLLGAAERAGVTGVAELLASARGKSEVLGALARYAVQGIKYVPSIITLHLTRLEVT